MNARIKDIWIKALLSGEYKQGTKNLHKEVNGEHQFCCLGVLCEVAIKEGIKLNVEITESLFIKYYNYDSFHSVLPPTVMGWSGVISSNGRYGNPALHNTLSELNDSGATFERIAKIIEKEF